MEKKVSNAVEVAKITPFMDDPMFDINPNDTKNIEKPKSKKLYEDNNWLVLIPRNPAAARKYGSPMWYISTMDAEDIDGSEKTFYDSSEKSPYIIVIEKAADKKWLINSYNNEFMNQTGDSEENQIPLVNEIFPKSVLKVVFKYTNNPLFHPHIPTLIRKALNTSENFEEIKKELFRKDFLTILFDQDDKREHGVQITDIIPQELFRLGFSQVYQEKYENRIIDNTNNYSFNHPWDQIDEDPEYTTGEEDSIEDINLWSDEQRERAQQIQIDNEIKQIIDNSMSEYISNWKKLDREGDINEMYNTIIRDFFNIEYYPQECYELTANMIEYLDIRIFV